MSQRACQRLPAGDAQPDGRYPTVTMLLVQNIAAAVPKARHAAPSDTRLRSQILFSGQPVMATVKVPAMTSLSKIVPELVRGDIRAVHEAHDQCVITTLPK